PHAVQACLTADGLAGLAVEGHFSNCRVQAKQLEDTQPSSITCVMAMIAPPAAHKSSPNKALRRETRRLNFGRRRMVRLLAFGAHNTHQSLSHDGNYTGSDEKRRHPNIDQARNSTG